jgi:hypothetical protein
MDVQRIRFEIQVASQHFPNIETATSNGELFVRAALQTTVGQMYVISVTFTGYPSQMPKVTVMAPKVAHSKHMYTAGHICYMHPTMWNPAKHDLKFVLMQTAVWLGKHEVYKVKGVWPGPALAH